MSFNTTYCSLPYDDTLKSDMSSSMAELIESILRGVLIWDI